MRIWCETCDGTGEIDNSTMYEQDTKKCPDCKDKGYTENSKLERLIKIGEATEKIFNLDNPVLTFHEQSEHIIFTKLKELIEWAESKGGK